MATDARLQGRSTAGLEDAAVYLVTTYRDEITSLITRDRGRLGRGADLKKIEAHIGRDLQFIRINGTVVGALAGPAIYTVSRLAGG